MATLKSTFHCAQISHLRRQSPHTPHRLHNIEPNDIVRQHACQPTTPSMAVTRVARIAAVAPVRAISERPVGEVVFDEGALGGVGVVEEPAPGCAEERQGALGVADSEAAEQFKGCFERRNVEWELGACGADRGPIAGGDGWNGGVEREVEEEEEGVCVLWM
jgi:hypothetical protein